MTAALGAMDCYSAIRGPCLLAVLLSQSSHAFHTGAVMLCLNESLNAELSQVSEDNYADWYDAFSDMPVPPPPPEPNLDPNRHGDQVTIEEHTLSCLACCPTARSVLARHPLYASPLLLVVPCKRWGCHTCAHQKIRRIALDVHAAAPNRLLTLTVDPKFYDNPELAWLSTRDKPAELFRALRRKKISLEYMKVTEVTKSGYPHYHCLLRSDFIPQKVAKSLWSNLTGATIVDIRQVTNQFNAVSYLVKYLTKLHRPDWTERALAYSRGFFPAPLTQTDHEADVAIYDKTPSTEHPYAFLARNYLGKKAVRLSPFRWLLTDQQTTEEHQPDYGRMGLRRPTSDGPSITLSQRHVF